MFPETKKGGLPGKPGGGKKAKSDKMSFIADTAAKTGKSKRTVERAVEVDHRPTPTETTRNHRHPQAAGVDAE